MIVSRGGRHVISDWFRRLDHADYTSNRQRHQKRDLRLQGPPHSRASATSERPPLSRQRPDDATADAPPAREPYYHAHAGGRPQAADRPRIREASRDMKAIRVHTRDLDRAVIEAVLGRHKVRPPRQPSSHRDSDTGARPDRQRDSRERGGSAGARKRTPGDPGSAGRGVPRREAGDVAPGDRSARRIDRLRHRARPTPWACRGRTRSWCCSV